MITGFNCNFILLVRVRVMVFKFLSEGYKLFLCFIGQTESNADFEYERRIYQINQKYNHVHRVVPCHVEGINDLTLK
jgi:hypothetical protein